jgi:membrane protein YqaA with SNARE-associated domain
MKHIAHLLVAFFWHWGGPALLLIGIADSSFLFAPLGNDLLVVAAAARSHSVLRMLYYAAMSTAGSILGVLLVDVVFRTASERGLEKHLSPKRIEYLKAKVTQDAAWALALASLAPPPFPFTPFVMAASALQYPRRKLLSVVGASRMVRFTALGMLALRFGKGILQLTRNRFVEDALIALTVFCIVGSVVSVVGWLKRGLRSSPGPPQGPPLNLLHPPQRV